jgi:hypothetical protein
MSDGGGAISDSLIGEAANFTSGGSSLLSLSAGSGIGASDDIDTTVVNLTAQTLTGGNIIVQETSVLVIAGTGVTTAGGGSVNIDVDAGNLTVDAVVTANGAGTVTLNADAGTIDINFAVSSTTGAIVVTGDVITQDANIATGGSGTVNVTADNGAITMADAISTLSVNGSITYSATTNVALALLTSTDAAISVTAGSGSSVVGAITEILSTEAANIVTTGTVTLTAETGIARQWNRRHRHHHRYSHRFNAHQRSHLHSGNKRINHRNSGCHHRWWWTHRHRRGCR